MRQLVSSDEAVATPSQHTTPCTDCPFARTALPGWLGGDTPEWWVGLAHGEGEPGCHITTNQKCAGLAIYRANVCKSPRDPKALRLPADREKVFANPREFMRHHKGYE